MSRLTNALIIIKKNNNKKVTEKVIFHPFAQKSPVNGFLPNLEQTFHTWTYLTNCVSICSMVSILHGSKFPFFP